MNNFLSSIPFFAGLSPGHMKELEEMIIERFYRENEIIFHEGDKAEAVFFVKSGRVRLVKSTPDGREFTLYIRKPGDLFAEVGLFNPNATYPATTTMIEEGYLLMLLHADLERLLRKSPDLAISIFQVMGQRLRTAQTILRDVALYGKLGSFCATLLRLASEHGKQTNKGILIDLELTHQELGTFIGATRESVNRIINDLKKLNIISVEKSRILIQDKEMLETFLK
ncbi:Crp/Fnr family transcriptional regulator [Aneurinibacillus sp. Ricciae_BoGa-3]|uniref:Crp/Fnr family transcriptional regulator n=1 Tax=Aneurinibacillus sp. Ricciae_BoGa-3 TaxID=3022697 RepID=UPI00233F9EDC|nr:Crp/Fnr family transcriptional regulator [Aneurinibacillus sp. Ricciae_BoGa-3]WCK52419.1 Crp/Fnr family transcriptional regulator [Aneurinibacillus sp. Ricciae_BoGa-3]